VLGGLVGGGRADGNGVKQAGADRAACPLPVLARADGTPASDEPADQYTVKLEGAPVTGYETVSFTDVQDPQILRSIDIWAEFFTKTLTERVESVLELAASSRQADLRLYGHNAILGELERSPVTRPKSG
jgi:hypothetical protein